VKAAGTVAGAADAEGGLLGRLLSREAGAMLIRNTAVSCVVFTFNLFLLWLLVEQASAPKLPAAALAFLTGNSLQYAFGRAWVFRGTDRGLAAGYVYFLINAGVGLVITLVLFAALLRFTPINYLVARTIVSVFAGLAMFALNATLNFRKL
jgi:putative flippase GtrA